VSLEREYGKPVIYSMTGYGRSEVGESENRFVIEVRSLNNRYLDIQLKSPRSLAALESRIRKHVQDKFSRGRFDIFISRSGEQEVSGRLAVNEARAGQFIESLKDLKKRYDLSGDINLSMVAGFPDIITVADTREDPEAVWQVLSSGLQDALDGLLKMRSEEGVALVHDVSARLETIDHLIERIQDKAPATVESARKRMTDTLGRLLNEQPDPVRLAQEIAFLAERTDVTEELTRLRSHMNQFRTMLADSPPEGVGRKLDFLIQEIGREVNTIASKAMDAEISLDVVHIKSELEKIREQIQNIE